MPPRRPSPFAFQFPPLLPGVRALLLALALSSIGLSALLAWGAESFGGPLAEQVVFQPQALWRGQVWRLVTFPFVILHDPVSLLFTGLMIWWLGSALESAWGRRRMLTFFFLSNAVAGVLSALLGLAWPSLAAFVFSGGWTTVMALVAGFAMALPEQNVWLFFFVQLRARTLIPVAVGIIALFMVMTGGVVPFILPLFALLAGIALADARRLAPGHLLLRLRVLWIERKMRSRKLSVVPGLPRDDDMPGPRSGDRGSDRFLH